MNGNELNNMAQRYKDEMMRLYKKSGASDNAVGTAGSQSFSAPQERQQTQAQQNPPVYADFPGSEQLSGITFSALSLFSKRYKGYVGNSRAECT